MPVLIENLHRYEEKNTSTTSKEKHKLFVKKYTEAENQKAFQMLKLASENFLITLPFFGYILTRQKIVEASSWLPTAGVDGKHFYYNTGFILSLKVSEIQFLLCHEILHLIYGHLLRGNYSNGLPRIHRLFNIANDYIVNADSFNTLKAGGGEVILPNGCYVEQYRFDGYVSEEVYEELINDIKNKIQEERAKNQCNGQIGNPSDGEGENQDGEGENQDGEGENQDDKGENQDDKGENQDDKGENQNGEITKEDIEKAIDEMFPNGTFDDHFDLSGDEKEGASGNGGLIENPDGSYTATGKPDLSKDAVDRKMENFKGDILIAKTLLSPKDMAGQGYMPGNALRVIKELDEPVFNWRRYVKKYVLGLKKRKLSWTTPKRRSNGGNIILPGKQKEKMYKIHVSLDTSGSISEEDLRDFLSEVYGAARQLRDVEITIWTFDTEIYNKQVFTKQNISRLKDYKIFGNGGTDFFQNWVYMKKENIKPDLFIMFTDGGYIGEPGIVGYCETLYVIHGKHRQMQDIPEKYGKTIYYEKNVKQNGN